MDQLPFFNVYAAAAGLVFCVAAGLLLLHRQIPLRGITRAAHFSSLEGKHVLITGGSSGIGLAIAKECLSQGACVSLIGRSSARLSDAAAFLSKSAASVQPRILLKVADVSDANAITAAIAECFEWKPVDVLICSAGVAVAGLFGEINVGEIAAVARTNLFGCLYCVHAAVPRMKTRSKLHPSSIVFVGSLSGMLFMSNANVYAATKYAIKGLAETLRFELMPYQIKVGLVCPGFVETPMLDEADKADALQAKLLSKVHSYDRARAQSADVVARRTMEGVKRGDFLITTCATGFVMSVLGRGLVPPDSLLYACIEMLLLVPLRLGTLVWHSRVKRILTHSSC